jgi:hypothetical protein
MSWQVRDGRMLCRLLSRFGLCCRCDVRLVHCTLQGFELYLRTVFLDNKVVFTFADAASIDPAAPAGDRLHMLQSRLESEALARAQASPSRRD